MDSSAMVNEGIQNTCMLCNELYVDPAMVECGQIFCRSCVDKAWASQGSFWCSDQAITEKKFTNKLMITSMPKTSGRTLVIPLDKAKDKPPVICPEHGEKLELYCEDDDTLNCVLCCSSVRHEGHKFLPATEAILVYRERLPTVVKSLEETSKEVKDLTSQQSKNIKQLQNRMTEYRQHITSEFGNLFKFLKERKEELLEKLRNQSGSLLEEMEANSDKMEEYKYTLKETILAANQKAEETGTISFLDGVHSLLKTCRKHQKALPSNTVTEEKLCQGSFKGPIQYFTWKQMASVTGPKEVWIVGNGYLINANHRAETGPLGPNLGFSKSSCTFHWWSVSKTWLGLFPKLKLLSRVPNIVLFHAGSNNLGCVDVSDFFKSVMTCIDNFEEFYPNTEFILSTLLPKPEWRGSAMEHWQKAFNSYLTERAQKPRFHLLLHNELEKKLTERYAAGDDRPLTKAEADMLLVSLRDALQKAMGEDCKPRFEKTEKKTQKKKKRRKKKPRSIHQIKKTNLHSRGIKKSVNQCMELSSEAAPADELQTEGNMEDSSDLSSEGEEAPCAVTEMWMVGSGFLTAAQRRAETSPLGLNLGFSKHTCNVRWLSVNGDWFNVFYELRDLSKCSGRPDIIYFHASIINLGSFKLRSVIRSVKSCLASTQKLFPNTEFILSTLLPKPEWWGRPVESQRRNFNSFLKNHAQQPHFHLLIHNELEKMLIGRYREGSVEEPTDAEADIFLTSVRDSVKKALVKGDKPKVEKFKVLAPEDTNIGKVKSENTIIEPCLPTAANTKQKEIWIVGNGIMKAANRRAATGPLGLNLGFDTQSCTVHWRNVSESWLGLFFKLKQQSDSRQTPDLILFHSGSNDLGHIELKTLSKSVKGCFSNVEKYYPNTKIIISTLLPKPEWQGTSVETRLIEFNSYLSELAGKPGFTLLTHLDLAKKLTQRYVTGDVSHLTEAETDLFLRGIRDGLERAILDEDLKPSVVQNISRDALNYNVQEEDSAKLSDPLPHGSKVESVMTSEFSDIMKRQREIWIVGNSYISRASLHAENGDFGKNLGFDEQQWLICWMGRTTRLFSLLPNIFQVTHTASKPSIVYLHIGSNDLGVISYHMLIEDFAYNIGRLVKLFPKTQLIISSILPRAEWLQNGVEENRKRFNTYINGFAKKCGCEVSSHRKLEEALLKRFKGGRLYGSLTYKESDMFLTDVKLSLQQAMLKASNIVIEKQEPQKEVLSTGGTLVVVVPGTDDASSDDDDEEEELSLEWHWPVRSTEKLIGPEESLLPNISGVK